MARELFPLFPESEMALGAVSELPMAKEIAWDFAGDKPILRSGEPITVAGAEAVKVWAFNAIKTVRYQWEMFSFQYGNELTRLIGQPFAADTKRAEAVRYIQEALLASAYITRVDVADLTLDGATLSAHVTISTVYGEVKLDV